MPLSISGKLVLPTDGTPAANAEIYFTSLKASQDTGEVLPSARSVNRCDADGNYSFQLEYGYYQLATKISTPTPVIHGNVQISAKTVATDLEDLLEAISIGSQLSEDLIAQFQELTDRAENAAASAEADAKQVAADKDQVAADKVQVAQDAQQVAADKNQVSQDAQQVAADKDQVAQDKQDVLNSVDKAHDWAVGPNPPADLQDPSDTNNSAYWSKEAKRYHDMVVEISSGLLQEGGFFTPADGAEYPSKPTKPTFWIIKPSDPEGYTFTTGTAAGIKSLYADWLVYSKTADEFELLRVSPLRKAAPATEEQSGVVELASNAEAEDSANREVAMTPGSTEHLLSTKTASDFGGLGADQYAQATIMGGIKMRVNEETNTLYISNDGSDV
ncbi:TPA: prophage tail fiber N-terminal domain-containing protein [Photobacterium damselae]